MQVYTVDLAVWYAAGRWVALLDYIDMLPSACRLNEAIANDPDTARLMAELRLDAQNDDNAEPWTPRVSEFRLEHVMYQQVINELKQIKQGITVQVTHKPPPTELPFPSPHTAIDRAIKAIEREHVVSIGLMLGFAEEDL